MTADPLPPRPRAAVLFAAAPVIFALLLLIAGGTVFVLGTIGGRARGARLEVRFGVPCAATAPQAVQASQSLLAERADAIGLGEPILSASGDEITLVATMPGLPDDRTAIPALLARQGSLSIRHGSEVLAERTDLEGATMRLDEAGMPVTDLALSSTATQRLRDAIAADPDGELQIDMDGQTVARRPDRLGLDEDHLVVPGEGETALRMRAATDRTIVLRHGPLPCALDVRSTKEQ